MPVHAVLISNRWRVVDADTGKITKNRSGTPVDGGGHKTKEAAVAQARAIDANLHREGKI